jgi:hypothetical protein
MANSKFNLAVTVNDNANGVIAKLLPSRGSPTLLLNAIAAYFQQMVGGTVSSSVVLQTTGVAAAGTVTFSSFTTGDTVTVGATTLTGSAGAPANESEFNVSGNDAADAVAFAACVNAHSVLSKYLSAAKTATATVTLTSLVPGVIGNGLALAISAHGSVVAFASGANDTNVTISHGI